MSKKRKSLSITCHACRRSFSLSSHEAVQFCPLCGHVLETTSKPLLNEPSISSEFLSDRYQLIEKIGKGGMGEVYLAFDSVCGRRLALKRIRSDLLEHPQIRHRFLKEAHITCQLTHPAIIPIYSIQALHLSAYYTMPFVEGETLKQVLRTARQKEKKGEQPDHTTSIPALMRVFITICQAVAYAHSKGVLHRDLKPENIIIGKYGETLILDWGLAKYLHSKTNEEDDDETLLAPAIPIPQNSEITKIGKVVGTVAYMAPERALGQPATLQTDIYALGVILYQLLTLKPPFKRGSLEEFRKQIPQEQWLDPVLAAPYRDVPRMLARAVEKCLNLDLKQRYQSVDELIRELENYLEGRSEWFSVAELDIKQKTDWEFQENVLIAEHMAITQVTEEAEWFNLMISRQSFTGNTQIQTSIRLGNDSHGIGILFSIPETSERTYINDGYCLWLGSNEHRSTRLMRSNVEVMQAPDIFLKKNQWVRLRIEKVDKTIHFYLDDILQFSYIALLPLIGTHIGLLSRDANFEMEPLQIAVGSLNLTVNCLAVPDAFLAHRDFVQALSEYRRIAYSFPDRAEGREAIFRSGLTFIEQSKNTDQKIEFLNLALQEFEKLHGTPGGPLEYLGKALVYQMLNEEEEEIKCFELAYRRYPNHPLIPLLQEQILSRMHEVSRQKRIYTYRFIFLTARHFLPSTIDTHTYRLFASLQKHWEILPFIEEPSIKSHPYFKQKLTIPLAFWLGKPYILGEIIDELLSHEQPSVMDIGNALVCLIQLGSWQYAQQKLRQIQERFPSLIHFPHQEIEKMIDCHQKPLEVNFKNLYLLLDSSLTFSKFRTLIYAMDQALDHQQTSLIYSILSRIETNQMDFEMRLHFDLRYIWALLLDKNWQKAGEVIYTYPVELLNKDSTLLHFLYGCWLQATEGKEMAFIHFTGLLHVTYPRSWTLASHELVNDLSKQGWIDKAFLWEKRELYRQLVLYYHCAGDEIKSKFFVELYQKQFIHVETN